MSLDGFHEWTPEEYAEKESAMSDAPRAVKNLVRGKSKDEFRLPDFNFQGIADEFLYQTAALNAVLGWLNFPPKLRSFFDALMVLGAGRKHDKPFQISNLDVGKQIRIGRRAKDEATAKSISRAKRKLIEWQRANMDLIAIELGKFDAKRRRRESTEYTFVFKDWLVEIVSNAADTDNWKMGTALRLKEIRRAARNFLNSLEKCPPLRGFEPKTLSEQEKLNRSVHLMINSHVRNLHFVKKMDWSVEELHHYIKAEIDRAFERQSGELGEVFVFEKTLKTDVAGRLQNGTLLDSLEELPDELFAEDDTVQQINFPLSDGSLSKLNHLENQIRAAENLPPTEFHLRDIASDNLPIQENDACNSLNPLTHDGTFLTEIVETVEPAKPNTFRDVRGIVDGWRRQFGEAYRDAPPSQLQSGVWQHYAHDPMGAMKQLETAELVVQQTIWEVADGTNSIIELKRAAIEMFVERLEFWQNGEITPTTESSRQNQRRKIEELLKLPEDFE